MGREKIFLVFFTLIGCPILTFASCAKNSDQEAINSELKQEINRLWAINEIQNLMGTYAFLQTSGMNFFAAERLFTTYDDTVIEMMWGRFIGKDAAYRAYTVGHRAYDQPTITALNIDIPAVDTSVPGASAGDVAPDPAGADNNIITSPEGLIKSGGASLHIHTLTTPVIQVARDGQTARAVWMCPGLEGTTLTWIKYGCDFKIQDGRWKIWHLHVYGILTGGNPRILLRRTLNPAMALINRPQPTGSILIRLHIYRLSLPLPSLMKHGAKIWFRSPMGLLSNKA